MKNVARILGRLIAGSAVLLLAACYGMPVYTFDAEFFVKDTAGKGIEGLQLTCIDSPTGYTNSTAVSDTNGYIAVQTGFITAHDLSTNTYVIEDTDGTNNGGKFATFTTNAVTGYYARFDVTMVTATD